MKTFKFFLIFLIINFGALGIGSWLMDNGPQTEWYISLNQAPWTPPGWAFGAAWTTIMLCFSLYMAFLYIKTPFAKVKLLFLIQFILNISWNYIFFNQHLMSVGLVVIIALTLVVATFMIAFNEDLKVKTLLILPYFIWLCIATSLNTYIALYN